MAKNPSAYLLILAILVLTTATSSSAQLLPPLPSFPPFPPLPTLPNLSPNLANGTQVVVAGIVTCPVGRTPPPSGPPVPGANVTLSCDGGRTSLGQAVTNSAGFYSITLNVVVPGILFNTTGCAIYVNLPLANCTSLPASGLVSTPLRLVSIIPVVVSQLPLVINQIYTFVGELLRAI